MRCSLRPISLIAIALVSACCGSAQVISLDPNYTASLFASGLQIPVNMVYRPSTNDFIVNQLFVPQITRVDATTGAVSVFANVPAGIHGDRGAYLDAMAINSKGEVFVGVYTTSGPILRFDSSGNYLGSFPVPGDIQGAAAFDQYDNFYIGTGVDGNSAHTIYKFAAGNYSTYSVFASGFASLEALAFNASGQLFAADFGAGVVYQVTPGSSNVSSDIVWASGITRPVSLAIDPLDQSLFVGQYEGGLVYRITSPGHFSSFATGFFVIQGNTTDSTEGLALDLAGNVYVADTLGGNVWKFTNLAAAPLQILPNHGGNAGIVTVRITGQGVESGATVTLSGSGSDIIGTSTALLSPGILGTTFDLTNAAPGLRSVAVNNPDGTVLPLSGASTIDQGGAPQVSVNIIGLNKARLGGMGTYYLTYANTGNIDWTGLAFFALKATSGVGPAALDSGGQSIGVSNPISLTGLPFVNSNPNNEALVGSFVLPSLPAATQSVPYVVQLGVPSLPANGVFDIWVSPHIIPPFLGPPLVASPIAEVSAQYLKNIVKLKATNWDCLSLPLAI